MNTKNERTVDPNDFKVPYAIDENKKVFQIKDGRPKSKSLSCPWCGVKVSFVSQAQDDTRAAHFRHKDQGPCAEKANERRKTIHDKVRDIVVEMLNGHYQAKDVCAKFGGHALPNKDSVAAAEVTVTFEGKTYRPDVTVTPPAGQDVSVLELEVVLTHEAEEERLLAAARAGHIVAEMDIKALDRDLLQRELLEEGFDEKDVIIQHVLANGFIIQTSKKVKKEEGLYRLNYLEARMVEKRKQEAEKARERERLDRIKEEEEEEERKKYREKSEAYRKEEQKREAEKSRINRRKRKSQRYDLITRNPRREWKKWKKQRAKKAMETLEFWEKSGPDTRQLLIRLYDLEDVAILEKRAPMHHRGWRPKTQ